MRILTDIIDKMDDTLDEIEWYTEKAHMLRSEHKALSDTYIKIAEMHVDIYKMLHDRVVVLIEEQKKVAPAPPMRNTKNHTNRESIRFGCSLFGMYLD